MLSSVKKYVSVLDFYAGKSVFITGGSGYLGKVLIEKLLYSCPSLDKIYVLIRDQKNIKAEQRLENITEEPIFSRLKAERPEDIKKLIVVKGELVADNLSMSPEDLQNVRNNVSIVIHSAATVKFNEPLKEAMATNLEGTRNVLNLCKSLKRVDAFVYVSTAYSNCNRKIIEEIVYPPPVTLEEAYELVEQDAAGVDLTKDLKGLPNYYTFTKALAENLVSNDHGDIPTVIVRPSIVIPAKSEPLPGWVDNWYGPTSLLVPLALGIGRTVYTQYDNNIDIIPVDYVCNLILVAAAKAERSNQVPVYNSCIGSVNPISIGESIGVYTKSSLDDGFNILPFPHLILYTEKKWLIKIVVALTYFIAYLFDILLLLMRKKPRFEKIYTQSLIAQNALSFFTTRTWLMKSTKALALSKSLSPEDYEKFPCNPQDINWNEYIPIYFKGVKKYLLAKTSKKIESDCK